MGMLLKIKKWFQERKMSNGFDKSHPYYAPATISALNEQEVMIRNEIQTKQTEALTTLAESVKGIANFLNEGGLQKIIAANARGQIAQAVLGGLAAHDGRKALDAQTIKQNSLELVEIIESFMNKMHERLQDKNRDPEIKEPKESP